MFALLQQMEQLLFFLEILGYIAIALMLLQIFLTIGVLSCPNKFDSSDNSSNESSNESSNKTSNDSSILRESYV